jgi:hypothetical protein
MIININNNNNNNNNPNNRNGVQCHERAQLPSVKRCRWRLKLVGGYYSLTGNDAYIYYIGARERPRACVCVWMFFCIFFFFLSRVRFKVYPSFLTHIVVGTCLHDRCCCCRRVHPPDRDSSDFGRETFFLRTYYIHNTYRGGVHRGSDHVFLELFAAARPTAIVLA